MAKEVIAKPTERERLLANDKFFHEGNVDKVIDVVTRYSQTGQRIKQDVFRTNLLTFLSNMANINQDLVHEINQASIACGVKRGLYFELIPIMDEVKPVVQAYVPPVRQIVIPPKYLGLVDWIDEQIKGSNKVYKPLHGGNVDLKDDSNIHSTRGKKLKFHNFMRREYRSSKELVEYAVSLNLSTDTTAWMVNCMLSWEYLKHGFYPSFKGNKFIVNRCNSINELINNNFLIQ